MEDQRGSGSGPRRDSASGSFRLPAKSLWCENVPESQGVRPTFQIAFIKMTFASSNPTTPGTQSVSAVCRDIAKPRLESGAVFRVVITPFGAAPMRTLDHHLDTPRTSFVLAMLQ